MSAANYQLLSFPNADALARAAAEQWRESLACSPGFSLSGKHMNFGALQNRLKPGLQTGAELARGTTVALSGGRIATPFFNAVARLRPQMDNVHFFWADERCVPPDHADSNYGTARQLLFEPLQIPIAHIHRIRGEDEPALAARLATEDLLRVAPKTPGGIPVLDVIFLGMGEDGHVASLFPDSPARAGVYYPVIGPKPPPQRITISYDVILAAKEVWVLASGLGKEAALTRSLNPAGDTPLARVVQGRKNTRIFCDFALKTA